MTERRIVTEVPFLSRQERFALVGSTNDVVREWLHEGTPEVCIAVADEQSEGRGREARSWTAPAERALLLSVGFRPAWLEARHVWRLAANVALAMADAAEEVAGLRDGTIQLKWPNDLILGPMAPRGSALDLREREITQGKGRRILKLAGVLGETEGLGSDDPLVVVGIGINADWPSDEFPPELAPTMTSLREASHGRPIDRALLLDGFLSRLEPRTIALRDGKFAIGDWLDRQVTTGRLVTLEGHGGRTELVRALGIDADSGGLVVVDPDRPEAERIIHAAEVRHVRLRDDDPAEATSIDEPEAPFEAASAAKQV